MALEAAASPVTNRFGIIDIGSNSVRMVVYSGMSRAPVPIFNEKILCGLGRTVSTTGRLDPEAVPRALRALERFMLLRMSIISFK